MVFLECSLYPPFFCMILMNTRLLVTYLACSICVSQFCLAVQDESERAIAREHTYAISKETTFVTKPLNDHGQIDFMSAINREFLGNIEPEQNAAVDIIPLIGVGDFGLDEQFRAAMLKELQVSDDKSRPKQLERFHSFVKRQGVDFDEFKEQLSQCCRRPWQPSEFSAIFKYLEEHESTLDAIVVATKKSKYFAPLLPYDKNDLIIMAMLPHDQEMRAVSQLICARAMLRLNEGDYKKSWQDIIAIKRLGQLVGSQCSLVQGLIGMAIKSFASSAARQFVVHAEVNADWNWQKCLEQWNNNYQTADISRQINFAERLVLLQLITKMADAGDDLAVMRQLRESGTKLSEETLKSFSNHKVFDFDGGLRWINMFYDQVVSDLEIEDSKSRIAAFEKLELKLQELETSVGDGWAAALGGSPSQRGEGVCKTYLTMLAPAVGQVLSGEHRRRDNQKVIGLALAVRVFETENDRLPESIDELSLIIGTEHFIQSLSGEPMRFQVEANRINIIHAGSDRKFSKESEFQNGSEKTEYWENKNDDWGIELEARSGSK